MLNDNLNDDINDNRRWLDGEINKLCQNCDKKCCNEKYHHLGLIFSEELLNYFPNNYQKIQSQHVNIGSKFIYGMGIKNIELLDIDGKPLPKPSLVQLFPGETWMLNIKDECPLLNENGKCEIYGNEKRPEICKKFPVYIHSEIIEIKKM